MSSLILCSAKNVEILRIINTGFSCKHGERSFDHALGNHCTLRNQPNDNVICYFGKLCPNTLMPKTLSLFTNRRQNFSGWMDLFQTSGRGFLLALPWLSNVLEYQFKCFKFQFMCNLCGKTLAQTALQKQSFSRVALHDL